MRTFPLHFLLTAAVIGLAQPAYAAVATSNTNTAVDTTVDTTANSGVTVDNGARINGGIHTGDSSARSNVDTDVRTDVDTTASDRRRTIFNNDARVRTGDVRARTDIRARRRAAAVDDDMDKERAEKNQSYHNESGQGNKYGHYKDHAENNPTRR
jgi:hypothetical protein